MMFIFVNMLAVFMVFCSKHKHFLLTLLSIEFLVLFLFLVFLVGAGLNFIYFSLIYLTFTACEGALGLSILVDMSRGSGSDFISLLNFSL